MNILKQTSKLRLLAAFAALAVLSTPAAALQLESTAEGHGQVTVEGTSTLHDWDVKGTEILGMLKVDIDDFSLDAFANATVEAEVRIPARSLTSENRGMDRRMYNALEASDHEFITFVLSGLSQADPEDLGSLTERAEDGALALFATGELTITGTTLEVEVPALVYWDDGVLRIEVEAVIVMSEYGIDPPRALMGTIRTGDEVTVHAVWTPASVQ